MTDKVVVLTTCPTQEEALRIARQLVDQRLAACVSVGAPVTSVYRWKEQVEEAAEVPLTIKSRRGLLPRLMAELRRLHSYEVPEILALPVVDGAPDYLDWMDRGLEAED